MGATGQQRTFGGQNFFRGGSPAAAHDWSGISQIGDVSPQLTQQLAGIANGGMPSYFNNPLSPQGTGNTKGPMSQNNGKPGINYSDVPSVGIQASNIPPILSTAQQGYPNPRPLGVGPMAPRPNPNIMGANWKMPSGGRFKV